jgi:hypothetical protein
VVEASVAAGQALKFNGTPSFRFITAEGDTCTLVGALPLASFARLADSLIAGEKPPEEPKAAKPELPLRAVKSERRRNDGKLTVSHVAVQYNEL